MNEYVAGNEDVYIAVEMREGGLVGLSIHLVETGEKTYGVMLAPETARSVAYNLTITSFETEDQGQ